MNYYRPEEKSEDSLFIRGSDDEDHQSHNEETSTVDARGSSPLTPPSVTSTARERHYSFAEHQEDLDHASPGRYLNQQQETRTNMSTAFKTGPRIPTSLSSSSTEAESLPQPNHHHSQPRQHDSDANNNNTNSNNSTNSVPADQERQILLLMLLAQVCALHDPTPRTFTVHVLELFERGILDRQSIHFLFDLGLVPSSPPPNLLMAPSSDQQQQSLSPTKPAVKETASSISSASCTDDKLAMVTMTKAQMSYQLQRSLEASAIRSTLEQHEEQQQQRQRQVAIDEAASPPKADATGPQNASPMPPTQKQQPRTAVSWSAEHHPLSLSRYQREFDQCGLLSSGSFGEVFRAKNKMDLREYAIKRVSFAATGYSRESVQQVVREVLCLAVCDHPNVVRYYTSWLEPSWMTGCGTAGSAGSTSNGGSTTTRTNDGGGGGGGDGKGMASKQKLLQDITHMVEGTGGSENLMDDLEAYFIDTGVPRLQLHGRQHHHHHHHHHRHFSLDASDNSSSWISDQDFVDGEEYSDWTIDDGRRSSKDDSFLQDLYRPGRSDSRSTPRQHNHDISPSHQQQHHHRQHKGRHKKKQNESFRYQICLFIQMQLCHPRSLADWIRERNRSTLTTVPAKRRLEPAAVIFSQIAHGLAHVHNKGIIHRDLKPANVFCSVEGDGLQFKIGDFGLSKLIRSVSDDYSWNDDHKHHHNLFLLEDGTIKESSGRAEDSSSNNNNGEPSWQDPLTAGIGTASYAAPEQVSTRSYGKEADIFSLGLMLLELVCSFSTEHERIQTFHDCRYRRKLPTVKHEQELFQEFPVLAETILLCTDPSPKKRPTADQLSNVNLMDTNPSRRRTNVSVDADASDEPTLAVEVVDGGAEESAVWHQQEESYSKQVSVLKKHLAEKDEKLKEKDDVIAGLRRQVHSLQQQLLQQTTGAATTLRLRLSDVEAESSSSDEGGL